MKITRDMIGLELLLSGTYYSEQGCHYKHWPLTHLDTGHSDRVIIFECDDMDKELDTLRKSLAEVKAKCQMMQDARDLYFKDWQEARAERDRLRDALEEISKTDTIANDFIEAVALNVTIARTALEAK